MHLEVCLFCLSRQEIKNDLKCLGWLKSIFKKPNNILHLEVHSGPCGKAGQRVFTNCGLGTRMQGTGGDWIRIIQKRPETISHSITSSFQLKKPEGWGGGAWPSDDPLGMTGAQIQLWVEGLTFWDPWN